MMKGESLGSCGNIESRFFGLCTGWRLGKEEISCLANQLFLCGNIPEPEVFASVRRLALPEHVLKGGPELVHAGSPVKGVVVVSPCLAHQFFSVLSDFHRNSV